MGCGSVGHHPLIVSGIAGKMIIFMDSVVGQCATVLDCSGQTSTNACSGHVVRWWADVLHRGISQGGLDS